ncbi:MAG: hypothetical protein AAFU64_19255, partial [Bacteroidota bacterium]
WAQEDIELTYHPDHQPTKAESNLDQKLLSCIKDASNLGESFSFSEWVATQYFYIRKSLDRVSSEHAGSIAIEKENVAALNETITKCNDLAEVQADFEKLNKVYQNEVSYTKSEANTGLFADEDIKATMDTGTLEKLKKGFEKIIKKLRITRRVIRVD